MLVDAALDDVALFVGLGVEPGWSPALATQAGAIGLLVSPLGDGGLDTRFAQVRPDGLVGVGLVAKHPVGTGARTPRAAASDADSGHHRFEGHRVMAVAGGDNPRDRATAVVGGEVNLGGQATAGAPQRLPIVALAGFLVIRPSPLCRGRCSRRPPRRGGAAACGGRRRCAGGRGPPWSPPPPTTPVLGRPRRCDSQSRRSWLRCCSLDTRGPAEAPRGDEEEWFVLTASRSRWPARVRPSTTR